MIIPKSMTVNMSMSIRIMRLKFMSLDEGDDLNLKEGLVALT